MTDHTIQAIESARRLVTCRALGVSALTMEYAHAIVELAGTRPNPIDLRRANEGDFLRAAGDAECAGARELACGRPYHEHPAVPGIEWLRRLCDGRFVKL